MYEPLHIFFAALGRASRAIRAGDRTTAEQWTRLAERHLTIVERRKRVLAPTPSAAATGPVMLDPNGFSPGGTSNRILNQQRMERSRVGQINPVK
ncbi:MAG TPA: hypothetical protein VG942_16260 [Hyphomonadaceae bacterium]|nr:hypothetical protein [Hyphomonadaceae bacterium]